MILFVKLASFSGPMPLGDDVIFMFSAEVYCFMFDTFAPSQIWKETKSTSHNLSNGAGW